MVLLKDEATGEVAPKKVTQTFVRQAPATLALTFSNGEIIETTAEHPFFVEHKGFTPAGLVAIDNSIVTRAGPSLQISKIEKKTQKQTVYNFSVADFHTYFVGKSALWVHNMKCVTEPRWRGGGTVANVGPNEVKIDAETGLLKTTHGVSLFDNADTVRKFGGAYRVASIPEGLKIEQRGQNLSHYEIMPERPMTMDEFKQLLGKIILLEE